MVVPTPSAAQPTFPTLSCQPPNGPAIPGSLVNFDIFLEDAQDVRGYQASITIFPISGSGDVTVSCPDGISVDENRSDFIFPNFDSGTLSPGCSDCGIVVTSCSENRVAVAREIGGVDVSGAPAYLATFTLEVSPDATEGSTFVVAIVSDPESILATSDKVSIPYAIGQPCILVVADAVPSLSWWALVALGLMLLLAFGFYSSGRGSNPTSGAVAMFAALMLGSVAPSPASAQACSSDPECFDSNVCSFDQCVSLSCSNVTTTHGDVAGIGGCGPDGVVDQIDTDAVLAGFQGNFPGSCSSNNLDLHSDTGCGQDGEVNLFDLLTVLDAFAGTPNCQCVQPNTPYEPATQAQKGTEPRGEKEDSKTGGATGSVQHPVYPFSGEYFDAVVDMWIEGRGLHFNWERKYRSKFGPSTVMGEGWDYSYNIYIEQSGSDLVLRDGNSRADTYFAQPGSTWGSDAFFHEFKQNPDTSYTLTYSNKGTWNFHPFDGNPWEGKLSSISDRNGNAISFSYDGLGLLVTIHDSLDTVAHNRDITIAYNVNGFIESVTDFIGRQTTYEYYNNGDAGGSFGDLKSVTTPTVTGTPTGNDFPAGKTTVYTYSKGFADARLNHNLLTETDPNGFTYLTNVYGTTQNANDLNFDRVVRQTWGDPGDLVDYVYVLQIPSAANNFATIKLILNDRAGNVNEYFYDADNRNVVTHDYTGRADPDQPTTKTLNRPTGKLRTGDPDFFETRFEWNADALITRTIFPNTNEHVQSYDSSNTDRRARGNLLQECTNPGPLGGDQIQICESYVYDPIINNDTNFVTTHADRRGNSTLYQYDANGNLTQLQGRISSILEDWEFNGFGQMTAHILPDNGNAHRRRDEFTYYTTGPQMGYLQDEIIDAPNFALTTTYEYDAVGNVDRVTDPRGHDTQHVINELNQIVRTISREVTNGSGVRYETDNFYDANDNTVRIDIQNIDDAGNLVAANPYFTTIYEHEILDVLVRRCGESGSHDVTRTPPNLDCTGLPDSEFVTSEYDYDDNRNQSLRRSGEAAEGRQPTNTVHVLYDERDLRFQVVRAQGDADQSTTRFDYDGNSNLLVRSDGIEGTSRDTQNTFDGYDRLTTSTNPMGNVSTFHYDENDNLETSRLDGELVDIAGSAGNVRLSESTYVFDAMDRLTRIEQEYFDTVTQAPIQGGQVLGQSIETIEYSDNSQVVRVVDDNLNDKLTSYDTVNRETIVTDPKDNTITLTRDENSNITTVTEVEKSDLGNPDLTFMTNYQYDNLDRRIMKTDNIGNTFDFDYDSRDNRTLAVDALSHETRYQFDGLNRSIGVIRDLDGDGADGDGTDIVTSEAWDDASRAAGNTDDSGNSTDHVYDALDRMTAEQHEDGTVWSFTFDVHDNVVQSTDANSSVVIHAYDLLDRLETVTVTPGVGVSNETTFEDYEYDGRSRRIRAEDDDSVLAYSYNSLSLRTSETVLGETYSAVYDGAGNKVSATYPGGRTVSTVYDELDRVKSVSDASGVVGTYDYIGPRRVERREYRNGTRTDYEYDGIPPNGPGDFGRRQIIRTTDSIIATSAIIDERTYEWDRMQNKAQRSDVRTGGPQLTHDYAYDPIYRLTNTVVNDSVPVVVRNTTYAFDGVGNRTSVTGSPDPGSYTMSATHPEPADAQANQYTTTPFDDREYDKNGNLTSITPSGGTASTILYNYRNQMVEYNDSVSGQRHVYQYDAVARRIIKIVDADGSATETRYFRDGTHVIEEQDGVGATEKSFVFGQFIDEVLNMLRAGSHHYYHADELLNVMAVTDAAGVVLERYDYQDYGVPEFRDATGNTILPITQSSIGNPFLFNTRRYDPEIGWYCHRTRYRDPRLGDWTTRDIIGAWGDRLNLGNSTTFVGNNPATFMDPFGLESERSRHAKDVKKLKKALDKLDEIAKEIAELTKQKNDKETAIENAKKWRNIRKRIKRLNWLKKKLKELVEALAKKEQELEAIQEAIERSKKETLALEDEEKAIFKRLEGEFSFQNNKGGEKRTSHNKAEYDEFKASYKKHAEKAKEEDPIKRKKKSQEWVRKLKAKLKHFRTLKDHLPFVKPVKTPGRTKVITGERKGKKKKK